MSDLQINADEIALVNKALMEFALISGIQKSTLSELHVRSLPPIRLLQVEHKWWLADAKYCGPSGVKDFILNITKLACWKLPVAVEIDDRDETYRTLGDMLQYVCAVCTSLQLDFQTLAKNFDSLPEELPPQGLDGLLNLYKAVGMLSATMVRGISGMLDTDRLRESAGTAVIRLCTAIHWLAFNSDWDASVLFQETMSNTLHAPVAEVEVEKSVEIDVENLS